MKKIVGLSSVLLSCLLFMVTGVFAEEKAPAEPSIVIYDVAQTVVKLSLKEGVTPEDAINAMMSKAVELNMRMVGRIPLSREIQARGMKARHVEIFQFCNPEDAIKMAEFDPIYAAYMPCRIALTEDKNGQYWLLTLNLDLLIQTFPLPDELRRLAITVNGQILDIMTAASTGEF